MRRSAALSVFSDMQRALMPSQCSFAGTVVAMSAAPLSPCRTILRLSRRFEAVLSPIANDTVTL